MMPSFQMKGRGMSSRGGLSRLGDIQDGQCGGAPASLICRECVGCLESYPLHMNKKRMQRFKQRLPVLHCKGYLIRFSVPVCLAAVLSVLANWEAGTDH